MVSKVIGMMSRRLVDIVKDGVIQSANGRLFTCLLVDMYERMKRWGEILAAGEGGRLLEEGKGVCGTFRSCASVIRC